MIVEVREGVDAGGWYFVQGNGKSARTMADLAKMLGVNESQLRFRPRALGKKQPARGFNSPTRIAARTDFDPYQA